MDIEHFTYNGMAIPERMREPLLAWIIDHRLPGDFLQAVLRNNLHDACSRADGENQRILPVYVAYLYNESPSRCWGSPEKVEAWAALRKD